MPTPPTLLVELPFANYGMEPFEFVLLVLIAAVALLCALYSLGSPGGSQFFVLALIFVITAGVLFIMDNIVGFYVLWEVEAMLVWAVGQHAVSEELEGPVVLPVQLAGAVASVGVLASLVLLHQSSGGTFSLAALSPQGNEWLGLVLLAAVILKTTALVGYSWRGGPQPLAAAAGAFILTAGVFVVGIYPFERLLLGTFGAYAGLLLGSSGINTDWREVAVWAGLGGAVLLSLAALGEQEARRIVSYVAFAQALILFVALALPNRQGLAGALLLLPSFTFSCAALYFALGTVELRTGAKRLADLGGLAAVAPGGAALFVVAAVTMIGLPPLGAFMGQSLFAGTLLRLNSFWPMTLYVLAVGLGLLALLRLFRGVFLGVAGAATKRGGAAPVSPLGTFALLLSLLAMAVAGFAPFWAGGVIEPLLLILLD